ncbi:SET domain-containing protein RMS1 [Cordyceps fumosorosea ARSEF 2679]|uniref:Ribosomal lysine N-methyltransferase 4 n=1 Tax=Cordyceps fumosorosea (strain ARSEF 2679) TaxID=1081104 RepID=A0A168EUM3_CORFA|nr:SET domain-containing protein RMS1 [Cordyceps fumosorosea ARSEF 2679]OAA74246.1 SET domain-containing protein RMS1 [Cordyceps fumosorosea ARSEF 2679]
MTDLFDETTASFLSWFKQLPGATFSDAIAIQDLRSRSAGRGIIALRDIPAETVLFTVPRASIISVETSALRTHLPALFSSVNPSNNGADDDGEDADPSSSARLDAWGALILVLLYEHLRGAASAWRPYLDALPSSFATPMFWAPAELAALQASATVTKVGREAADDAFRGLLLPAVRAAPDVFAGSADMSDDELLALAHRMGSTIMAYAFDLEKDEDEDDEDGEDGWVEDRDGMAMMGMVPMADMLNADAEFNAHVNHGDDELTITALRPIKAGEEILNYYGPHPNSELLRRYGYVTERHARYDVVEIPWEMIEAAAVSHLGLPESAWAKVRGHLDEDELEDTFVLERACPEVTPEGTFPPADADADGAPRFAGLPGDLEQQLGDFLRAARAVDLTLPAPDKRRREELRAAIVASALTTLEAQYPTTLAQDEQLLADAGAAVAGDKERMALVVRVGEKRLLREARAFLEAAAAASQQQQEHGGASPMKRPRLE